MDGTFFCNKCGAQNAAGAQFCSRCGTPTSPTSGVIPAAVPSSIPAPPYAATAPSYPGVAPAAGVGYGGFWIRVVAAIIDGILVRVVVSPIHLFFGGLGLAGMMSGIHPLGLALFGGGVTF
ncbi:MAG: zinc ribbon domain-containing protein, partial [Terriglobales bacterium]